MARRIRIPNNKQEERAHKALDRLASTEELILEEWEEELLEMEVCERLWTAIRNLPSSQRDLERHKELNGSTQSWNSLMNCQGDQTVH